MNIFVKIVAWIFYVSLFYFTCSLIMWELDIRKWHILVRSIFAVFEFWITLKVLLTRVPKYK